MEKINFELDRDQLLELKHKNNDVYQMIMSLKKEEKDYCETLDKEKLKKECELGYFCISDLFTREQISNAHNDNNYSIKKPKEKPANLEFFAIRCFTSSKQSFEEFKGLLGRPVQSVDAASFVSNFVGLDLACKHLNLIDAILKKKEIKIRVTPEQSEIVQKICFALGVKWGCGSTVVEDTHMPYLFIVKYAGMFEIHYGYEESYFSEKKYQEYSFEKGAFV